MGQALKRIDHTVIINGIVGVTYATVTYSVGQPGLQKS